MRRCGRERAHRETEKENLDLFDRLLRAPALAILAGVFVVSPPATLRAQGLPSVAAEPPIEQAWDSLLSDVIPQAPADKALTVPQPAPRRGSIDDFKNHFFFQGQTEYIRVETSFSGRPTPTGVINEPRGENADPDGIPAPEAFQPNSDHLYTFFNWGTRGWLSERVNTNFSFRYRQNLSQLEIGSPSLNVLNTFGSNRRLEMLSAFAEIRDLTPRGPLANSTLQVGRQYVYGAEPASLDGASLTLRQRFYTLTLFGGRRFTFYSNPDQRAMGGANLALRLTRSASLEYQTLYYIQGSHVVNFRKRFEPNWLLRARYKMVGGSPVDLGANVAYSTPDGRSVVRLGFFQKLSDKDFFYDYTLAARDLDSFNRLPRLYLGPIPPYSQVSASGSREVASRLRLGGAVVVRRLNDDADQDAFAASFEDYRVNAQVFPVGRIELLLEYHRRNVDRASPLGAMDFDDVSRSGETLVQDFSGEIRRAFGEGKLILSGGAFYRRMDLQNKYFFIEGERVFGFLGSVRYRMRHGASLYVDYSLDEDFLLYRPSIQRSHVLRVGGRWRY